MKVNPVSFNSFTGSVKRTVKCVTNGLYQRLIKRETSKDEWIGTYQQAYDKIARQQKCAMELDRFMHTDEIIEKVAKLPEDVDVEICHNFNEDYFSTQNLYKGLHLSVVDYEPFHAKEMAETGNIDNRKVQSLKNCWVQNDDGSLNKQTIVDWLDMLQGYFN